METLIADDARIVAPDLRDRGNAGHLSDGKLMDGELYRALWSIGRSVNYVQGGSAIGLIPRSGPPARTCA